MKDLQIELAAKFIAAMKKHWRKTNPHVDIVMNFLMKKYGELPRPDHMAIRSISGAGFGIQEASSLFSALGYKFGGYWPIPNLNINACHFEPPTPELEKIFFSEIDLSAIERNAPAGENFHKIKSGIRHDISSSSMELYIVCGNLYSALAGNYAGTFKALIDNVTEFLIEPPCYIKSETFSKLSQKPYLQETIHVLAYGFQPNHFTFLLKDPSYTFPGYASMENFAKEIDGLGIQMQEKIEGDEESILCQVSTKACMGKFSAYQHKNGRAQNVKIEWPMSYIEFIRRGADTNSPTGRYEGFLPKQAQTLFKMTAPTGS